MHTLDLLLFESPPPGKIRALTWITAAILALCVPASVFVFGSMTRDDHSAELAPLAWRIAFAACILAIGAGFFCGMLLYLRYYTTRLFQVAGTENVCVETLRLFGLHQRTLAANRITSSSFHRGKLESLSLWTPSVDAPWFWVNVSAGRGFLLDVHGQFHHVEALAKLLSANHTRPLGGDVDQLE